MKSGQLTRKIMTAAKDEDISLKHLELVVLEILTSFPLSSDQVVFDQDLDCLGARDIKDAVLVACVRSDKAKLEAANRRLADYGAAPLTKFGRATLEVA